MINHVVIDGRLCADPETRSISSGSIAEFTVCHNQYRKVNDQWEETPHFFVVTCFGRLAERCIETLKKGDPCIVAGRLQQDQWKDKHGNARSRVKVVAQSVEKIARDTPKHRGTQSQERRHQQSATHDEIPF